MRRSEPLMLRVSRDPDAPDAEAIPVAVDDPGAMTYRVWVVLEALVAGGLVFGQAVLDEVRVRYWQDWHDGAERDDATLIVQVGLEGDVLEATFEAMLIPGGEDGGPLLRSVALPVRALCDPEPSLEGVSQ